MSLAGLGEEGQGMKPGLWRGTDLVEDNSSATNQLRDLSLQVHEMGTGTEPISQSGWEK